MHDHWLRVSEKKIELKANEKRNITAKFGSIRLKRKEVWDTVWSNEWVATNSTLHTFLCDFLTTILIWYYSLIVTRVKIKLLRPPRSFFFTLLILLNKTLKEVYHSLCQLPLVGADITSNTIKTYNPKNWPSSLNMGRLLRIVSTRFKMNPFF